MILLIDNYDSFTYNLYQLLSQLEKDVEVTRNNQITLEAIEQMAPKKIVLSPGPGRPSDAGICIKLIQKFRQTIPILGVCLGHQAIAEAMGGKVIQAAKIVHGKETFIFHNRKHIFKNMPLPFRAGRYHSLIVERETLPERISIEAENGEEIIMAIKLKEYPVYGVQFHPESILTPDGARLIENFVKEN